MLKFEIILARQNTLSHLSGPVAQWITRLTTDQKIPGSNPGKVAFFFFFLNPNWPEREKKK